MRVLAIFSQYVTVSQKRCKIGPKLLLMTNRKLHTPLRSVPKSTTLDDVERPIRTLLQKRCFFLSPPQKNLNDDRPTLTAEKCRSMTLLSGDIGVMRIFEEIPWGGGVKRQWSCRQRLFSVFSPAISSETLLMRPALLYSDMQSIVCLSAISKCMTLNDLEWLFRVVFAPVWLAPTVRLSKNNCVKTNKNIDILRHIVSGANLVVLRRYKVTIQKNALRTPCF